MNDEHDSLQVAAIAFDRVIADHSLGPYSKLLQNIKVHHSRSRPETIGQSCVHIIACVDNVNFYCYYAGEVKILTHLKRIIIILKKNLADGGKDILIIDFQIVVTGWIRQIFEAFIQPALSKANRRQRGG